MTTNGAISAATGVVTATRGRCARVGCGGITCSRALSLGGEGDLKPQRHRHSQPGDDQHHHQQRDALGEGRGGWMTISSSMAWLDVRVCERFCSRSRAGASRHADVARPTRRWSAPGSR
jgi:hypothetical protein